ncbi:MAG: hypothetical protein M0R03_22985 [Novosphingobium sp.]|nr:hypothetical protein [Novosphingobium sp.]
MGIFNMIYQNVPKGVAFKLVACSSVIYNRLAPANQGALDIATAKISKNKQK